MEEVFVYLLKMLFCSILFFTYYKIFLKNRTFHRHNRFYLLGVVTLSIILPFINFNFSPSQETVQPAIIKVLSVTQDFSFVEEFVAKGNINSFDKWQLVSIIYLLISLFFFVVFINTVIIIYRLKKSNLSKNYQNFSLIFTHDKRSPFSFLNNIFWNSKIDLESEYGKRILIHEVAHIQQKHSYDKIFINLVLIVFWFNPFFWLIRNELNLIHEFLADKKAMENGDTEDFAKMILITVYPESNLSFINPFFYSPVKRRIQMLTKKNNPNANYVSRLLVLPVIILGVMAFSSKQMQGKQQQTISHQKIKVVLNAGHGGQDVGSTGHSYNEKDIALTLVKRIIELNSNKNIELILTRKDDVYQSPKEIANFSNKENPDLYVSVHLDAESTVTANPKEGLAVVIAKDNFQNSTDSKIFASALIGVFKNNYGLNVADNPVQRSVGIWTLQESKCPSILIEAGVITNKKDLDYLLSIKGQETFANNVLNAISLYAVNVLKEK